MLPNHYLDVESNDQQATLAGKYSFKFYFQGFSGEASATPSSSHMLNTVVVRPTIKSSADHPDLLALTVVHEQYGSKGLIQIDRHSYVLPVYLSDGKVVVGIEKMYIPKELFQVYNSNVRLQVGEYTFTTNDRAKKEIYVSDANMICRLAAGRATIEEVLEVAERPEREKEERVRLAQENADLTAQIERHRETMVNMRADLHCAQDELTEERKFRGSVQARLARAEACILRCQNMTSRRNVIGRQIDRLLWITGGGKITKIKNLCEKYLQT